MTDTRVIYPNNRYEVPQQRMSRIQEAMHEISQQSQGTEVVAFQKTVNVLINDNSASTMGLTGSKRASVKHEGIISASSAFVANLPLQSMISIISFSNAPELIIPLSSATDKLAIIQKLHSIPKPDGMTELVGALLMAERELAKAHDGYKRIFILTDGIFTDKPFDISNRLKSQGVSISCVGFGLGDDIDESGLISISSIGPDGRPSYRNYDDLSGLTSFMKQSSRII